MSLKGVAKQTLRILEDGFYINSRGERITLSREQSQAVEGTRLYTPQRLRLLLENVASCAGGEKPGFDIEFEVSEEKTQPAARRLVVEEGIDDLLVLNFASARNPGGGFVNGAKAQEEDVTRACGLYPCLLAAPAYYEANRRCESLLYTDHMIYAPRVPWFRTGNRELLDGIFLASVITAPAPNAGQHLRKHPDDRAVVEAVLKQRSAMVLSVARENHHRNLLLGAWGCGVFGNEPRQVAESFAYWLRQTPLGACFDRVIFAVYSGEKTNANLAAFKQVFGAP